MPGVDAWNRAIHGNERSQAGIVLWEITEHKCLAVQIVQAEKRASLGTLVVGVAPEVNNPAQSIMRLAQLMQDEMDLNMVSDYAWEIVGYPKHSAVVVRDFSTSVRPSGGDGETEMDLGGRMVEAVKLLRRSPQFGHVEVVRISSPCRSSMPQVRGDGTSCSLASHLRPDTTFIGLRDEKGKGSHTRRRNRVARTAIRSRCSTPAPCGGPALRFDDHEARAGSRHRWAQPRGPAERRPDVSRRLPRPGQGLIGEPIKTGAGCPATYSCRGNP